MNVAYGYMLYNSLQNPSTNIEVILPSTYILCVNVSALVSYTAYACRSEMEQFLENLFRLNIYMGTYIILL